MKSIWKSFSILKKEVHNSLTSFNQLEYVNLRRMRNELVCILRVHIRICEKKTYNKIRYTLDFAQKISFSD